MTRGNHLSAREFTDFWRIEIGDMRKKGIFIVLPYDLVRHLDGLRLSPMGVVQQRNRRPRTIIDYTYSAVNEATHKLTPQESMQWGRALQRLLWFIYYADRRHGPVLLAKTDLSDGFYQLHLTPSGALQLAMPFPSTHDEPPLVAIPTRLPMGWTESPPVFSTATETIADIANAHLEESMIMPPPHPLEPIASSQVPLRHSKKLGHFVHLSRTLMCTWMTLLRLYKVGTMPFALEGLFSIPLIRYFDPMALPIHHERNRIR